MNPVPLAPRAFACAALSLLTAAAAAPAQQFVNGDFETGDLTGWTITPTSANGTTASQGVTSFDIDGAGPLAASNAGTFQVGQVNFAVNDQEGIEVTQTLTLSAGVQYTLSCNWAAIRGSTTSNAEGGVFTLFVEATNIMTAAAGSTSSTAPHYGTLTGVFTPGSTGSFRAGVRITRPYLTGGGVPDLYQYIDNVTITGPGSTCPAIGMQPVSHIACPSGSAPFSVSATGTPPLNYQWQIETAPGVWQGMANDPGPLPCGGGAFSYASPINSPTVTIGVRPCPSATPGAAQHFQIRCVVSNACGGSPATSNEATYTICPADFNCSGAVSVQDIFDFLTAWFAHTPSADFNTSGAITVQDLFDFLAAWFAGCS